MKKIKILLLMILFTTGLALQNCDSCPPFEGGFFDIQGVEIINYTTTLGDEIEENQVVEFAFYGSLALAFQVEYLVNNWDHNHSLGFSFMNAAYAEDCLFNGVNGSKEERINSLTVLTLNDFNEEYKANDTINELLNVRGTPYNLNEYLAVDTSFIQNESFELDLRIPPTLNEEFKVKMILELSTNEMYEAESIPFIIR